jgi:uncharacterized protein (DUF1786 family)
MKLVAVDIGVGTEDVLLYDDEYASVENCVKMVLPAPSRVFADRVRAATRSRRSLFLRGDVIGGGAVTSALRGHLDAGLRVVMTETAAYTVRNDLDEMKELGIEVIREDQPPSFDGETVTLEEVNLTTLNQFLSHFDETLSDVDGVALAVQDHGVFPKGTSNRRFRLQKMRKRLEANPRPESLMFPGTQVPPWFLRMRSAVQASRRQLPNAPVFVMDTAPAAVLGCLRDPVARDADPLLAVNVGNGHTMAALIERGRIIGLMEHHTRSLNAENIAPLLRAFADGGLTDDAVFSDGGHGLFFLDEAPSFARIETVLATGPNRRLLAQTPFPIHFAAPAGDVMMTGPLGLVEGVQRLDSRLPTT